MQFGIKSWKTNTPQLKIAARKADVVPLTATYDLTHPAPSRVDGTEDGSYTDCKGYGLQATSTAVAKEYGTIAQEYTLAGNGAISAWKAWMGAKPARLDYLKFRTWTYAPAVDSNHSLTCTYTTDDVKDDAVWTGDEGWKTFTVSGTGTPLPGDFIGIGIKSVADASVMQSFVGARLYAGTISAAATCAAGTIFTTADPHGLVAERYVTITGTTSYDTESPVYVIATPDTTHFITAQTYVDDRTGTWSNVDGALALYRMYKPTAYSNNPYVVPSTNVDELDPTNSFGALAVIPMGQAPNVIHFGDSNAVGASTDVAGKIWPMVWSGGADIPITGPYQYTYPAIHQVASRFGWIYQNLSCTGRTASTALEEIEAQVIARNPSYVIISFGVNDLTLSDTPANIAGYLTDMVDLCVAAGIVPIVTALNPVPDTYDVDFYRKPIYATNQILKTEVPAHGGLYSDASDALGTFDTDHHDLNAAYHKEGNGHLNIAGHQVWFSKIANTLFEAFSVGPTTGAWQSSPNKIWSKI